MSVSQDGGNGQPPMGQGGPRGPIADRLRAPLPRRFYSSVGIEAKDALAGSGFAIVLDGRPIRTPAKRMLLIPDRGYAEIIAAEWQAQAEVIDPASMPATRLANSALDTVAPARGAVVAEIVAFAGSDLLCYRAEGPHALVERQCAIWDPILDRVARVLAVQFKPTTGVIHIHQPAEALAAVEHAVCGLGDFPLAGVQLLTVITGSALLAVAGLKGLASASEIWEAAHVDEDWQKSRWGEDAEAAARRVAQRRDFEAAAALLGLKS